MMSMEEYELQQARLELYHKLAEAEAEEANGEKIDHAVVMAMLRKMIDGE